MKMSVKKLLTDTEVGWLVFEAYQNEIPSAVMKTIQEIYGKINQALTELEDCPECEKHRWIPVSERLPTLKDACEGQDQRCRDGTVDVIGVDINGFVFGANYFPKMNVWNFGTEPTHWKPIILPEQALKDKP